MIYPHLPPRSTWAFGSLEWSNAIISSTHCCELQWTVRSRFLRKINVTWWDLVDSGWCSILLFSLKILLLEFIVWILSPVILVFFPVGELTVQRNTSSNISETQIQMCLDIPVKQIINKIFWQKTYRAILRFVFTKIRVYIFWCVLERTKQA